MKTKRLTLRPFCLADVRSFHHNFSGDERNLKYFTGFKYDVDRTKALIEQWLTEQNNGEHWRLAIDLNNEVIGIISVRIIDTIDNTGEISFGIGNRFWGRGLASEAVNAVLSFCLDELHLTKIFSAFDKRNTRAIKLAQRCGMTFSKEIKESNTTCIVYFLLYEKTL